MRLALKGGIAQEVAGNTFELVSMVRVNGELIEIGEDGVFEWNGERVLTTPISHSVELNIPQEALNSEAVLA